MAETMKALNLHAVGDLRYEDVPMPEPLADEVLVRVRAAGICGSDIQRVLTKGTYHFPTIPGHEFSGEVVALGAKADPALLGKRVAVFPLLPCRECEPCAMEEYAQCKNYDYYGSRRDGGFAEYLAVKVWNLVFVPDNVSFEEAAMCEPTAVAFHALGQFGVKKDSTVLIFGAGTIGLMLAKVARMKGAARVILADIDEKKLAFANKLGFADTVNSSVDPTEQVLALTNGRGADLIVEGAGVSATYENCMKCAATFGEVVLMGNPIKEMTLSQKAYWEILRKQLTLRGTWNSAYSAKQNDWQDAVNAMPELDLLPMITGRHALSEGIAPFEHMADRNNFTVKEMFIND